MSQRRERRLMEGLAHRRMGVDGERDVFEARAYFERERRAVTCSPMSAKITTAGRPHAAHNFAG
jgi:hypothetical protein